MKTTSEAGTDMSTHAAAVPSSGVAGASAVTLPVLARMAAEGQKIAMLTAYDATLAAAATIPGRGLARRFLHCVRDQRIARTRSHFSR